MRSAGQPTGWGCGAWSQPPDTGRSFETEAQFVDAVARGLRTGRILLLVAGDGIREEVERIAAYVQAAPQLQFALALIELRIFEHPGGMRVVVPSIVARTAEVTRAVVHVDVAPEAKVKVSVAVPGDDSPTTRRKRTLEEFFAILSESAHPGLVGFVRQVLEEFDEDPRFALVIPQAGARIPLLVRHPSRRPAPPSSPGSSDTTPDDATRASDTSHQPNGRPNTIKPRPTRTRKPRDRSTEGTASQLSPT